MRGVVKEVSNFLKGQEWLFTIEDSNKSHLYYVGSIYKKMA